VGDAVRSCSSCGNALADGALFCPSCGAATPTEISRETDLPHRATATEFGVDEQRRRVQNALGESFQVLHLLGQGGFAEVWAATDLRLKRQVAVKVLRGDLVISSALSERFRREAEAVAKLRHPNIVPIYQVGEGAGLSFYVMPLIEGESLRHRMEQGPLPIEEVRRILQEVAGALSVAHKAGIIHRDIKPDNIMLEGEEARPVVMDFGIAKALSEGEAGLTGTGMIVGTPHYMSPEQASGEKTVDSRSDIYSLGVVGYQMVAGHLPFEGGSAQEVLVKQIAARPKPLDAARPDTPVELAAAVMKCLKKEPAERWNTAGELAAAVRPPRASLGWAGRRAAGRMARQAFRIRVKPRRWHALLLVLVLLAGGLAVGGRELARDALEFWVPRRHTAPALSEPWANLEWLPPWWDARLESLGDTLVLVSGTALRRPRVFDGTAWTTVPLLDSATLHRPARFDPTIVRHRDSVWMLADRRALYLWTSRGLIYRDSLGFDVSAAWSDAEDVVLGTADGGIIRRSAAGWKREPTGAAGSIEQVWGHDAQHLFALSRSSTFSPFNSEQLLAYDGFRWNKADPDTTFSSFYEAGAALGDGSAFILRRGFRRGSPSRSEGAQETLPLVLRYDSSGATWHSVDLGFSSSETPIGLWGRSVDDFYAWGYEGFMGGARCPANTSCLIRVLHGRPLRVPDVPHLPVVAIASLRGFPCALFQDGSLWASRNGRWRFVTSLPRSRLLDVAVSPTLGQMAVSETEVLWSGTVMITLPEAARPRRIVAGDSTAWVLTESGAIFLIACHRPQRTRNSVASSSCQARPVLLPDRRRINDLALDAQGHLLAAGDAGLIASWSGDRARIDAVPGEARRDTLVRLLVPDSGAPLALGRKTFLRRTASGKWTLVRRFGTDIGLIHDAAALSGGRVAVSIAGEAQNRILILGPDSSGDLAFWESLTGAEAPERLLALTDDRLAAAYAHPDDPSVGGRLVIYHVRSDRRFVTMWQVPLPRTSDLYGIARDSAYLYVVGSGWLAERIPLNAITKPGSRGTLGMQF